MDGDGCQQGVKLVAIHLQALQIRSNIRDFAAPQPLGDAPANAAVLVLGEIKLASLTQELRNRRKLVVGEIVSRPYVSSWLGHITSNIFKSDKNGHIP